MSAFGFEGIGLALAMFALLMAMLALRVPIAVAMMAAGATGYVSVVGWAPLAAYLKSAAYFRFSNYDLSIIPLFLLMGSFAGKAGVSAALYRAGYVFLGHRRGGLAMATIGACAGFGAICGSSLATAATMCQVALPEMRRYGYSGRLATGTLAAGGTLGILIPPSVVLAVYGILAEQNIGTLFLAAIVPGLIATAGYMLAIAVYVRLHPEHGPAGARATPAEKWAAVRGVWPVVLIFTVVIGGIYGGVFTPTEAAAVGAFATGVLARVRGGLDRRGLVDCIAGTAETTAMIFLILLGADIFNAFLAFTRMPADLAAWIADGGFDPMAVVIAVLLLYFVLGCLMDSLSMILLTIPVFLPAMRVLDFGMGWDDTAIWFGILVLVTTEVGLITPPVGMNVYVINSMARDVPMSETFRGVMPFLASDMVRIALLTAFPALSLWVVWVAGS
ncbi:MAG TPA: TRAP transporter large permease [Azospirillaceae bacterium]|nr:TRAP transporter large permease [Azospirillaceae bacterium]